MPRGVSPFHTCMKRELSGGKMKNKTKAQRIETFKKAVKKCKKK